jgi:hypothetical protein
MLCFQELHIRALLDYESTYRSLLLAVVLTGTRFTPCFLNHVFATPLALCSCTGFPLFRVLFPRSSACPYLAPAHLSLSQVQFLFVNLSWNLSCVSGLIYL